MSHLLKDVSLEKFIDNLPEELKKQRQKELEDPRVKQKRVFEERKLGGDSEVAYDKQMSEFKTQNLKRIFRAKTPNNVKQWILNTFGNEGLASYERWR